MSEEIEMGHSFVPGSIYRELSVREESVAGFNMKDSKEDAIVFLSKY